MARCEFCGNDYGKAFQVQMPGRFIHIQSLRVRHLDACANVRSHCGGQMIGHSVEAGDRILCCANVRWNLARWSCATVREDRSLRFMSRGDT
jgi:hypothetical protein